MRGFTLVELMIVVGIISILGAVALPSYQQYTVRAKMSEVILALSACRASITELYQGGGDAPGAGNWGCDSATGSKHVASIATDEDGKATVTIQNVSAAVNGKVVTFVPLVAADTPATSASDMGRSLYAWRCGASGDGTDIDAKYLPGSCRG